MHVGVQVAVVVIAVLLCAGIAWIGAAPALHLWPFGGCMSDRPYTELGDAFSMTTLTPPSHCLRDADCGPGASCVDGACMCPGAAARRKQEDSPCPVTPNGICDGHGVCDEASGSCTCETGRFGPACADALPATDRAAVDPLLGANVARQCSGHGHVESDGFCACDEGWTGPRCDTYLDPNRDTTKPIANKPPLAFPRELGGVGPMGCGDHGTPTYDPASKRWSCVCDDTGAGDRSWSGDHCETPPPGNVYAKPDQSDVPFLCGNYGSYASTAYDPVTSSCRPSGQNADLVPCPNGFYGPRCEKPCTTDKDCGQGMVSGAKWTSPTVLPGTIHVNPMGICNLPGRGPGLHDPDQPDFMCLGKVPAPGGYGRCSQDHDYTCRPGHDDDCDGGVCEPLGTCGGDPGGLACFGDADCDANVTCVVPPDSRACLQRRCREQKDKACAVDSDCGFLVTGKLDECVWAPAPATATGDCPSKSVRPEAAGFAPSPRSGPQLRRRPAGARTCERDADCGSQTSCTGDADCVAADGPGSVCSGCQQLGSTGVCAYRHTGMAPDVRFCAHSVVQDEIGAGNSTLKDVACCPTHPERKVNPNDVTTCGTGTCYMSDGSVVSKILDMGVTGLCDHDPNRPCRSVADCLDTAQTVCFGDDDCGSDVPGLPNTCLMECQRMLHDSRGQLLPAAEQPPVETFGVCMGPDDHQKATTPTVVCAHDQQCPGQGARCVALCDPAKHGKRCVPVVADGGGGHRVGSCQSVGKKGNRANVCGAAGRCECPESRRGPFCELYTPPGSGCHGNSDCASGICVAIAPGYGMCFTGSLSDDTRMMYAKLRAGLEMAAVLVGFSVTEKYVLRGLVSGFGRALVEGFEKAGFETTSAALRYVGEGGLRQIVKGGVTKTLGSIVRGFSYMKNLSSVLLDEGLERTTQRATAELMEGFVERVAARAVARTMSQEAAEAAVETAMDGLLASISGPVGVVFAILDVLQIVGMVLDIVDPMHIQNELRQAAIDMWMEGMRRAYNAQLAVVGADAMPAAPPTGAAKRLPEFLRQTHSAAGQRKKKKYLVEYIEGLEVNSEGQVVLRCGQSPTVDIPAGLLVPRTGFDALLWRMSGKDMATFRRLRSGGGIALLVGGSVGTLTILTLVVLLIVLRSK